jgi:hypothetical protein
LCVVARMYTYRYKHVHRMYVYTRTQPYIHTCMHVMPAANCLPAIKALSNDDATVHRVQNMERALFDCRQSVAEKEKRIAHLETRIGRAESTEHTQATRRSQILTLPSQITNLNATFSPREDMPSPQCAEPPKMSARELEGSDLLPRAPPHGWNNYSGPERSYRRIPELCPDSSLGDREISNRAHSGMAGGALEVTGRRREPPVPLRALQHADPLARTSPPAPSHAPIYLQDTTTPQWSQPHNRNPGSMRHSSNPSTYERGGAGLVAKVPAHDGMGSSVPVATQSRPSKNANYRVQVLMRRPGLLPMPVCLMFVSVCWHGRALRA